MHKVRVKIEVEAVIGVKAETPEAAAAIADGWSYRRLLGVVGGPTDYPDLGDPVVSVFSRSVVPA